MTTKRRRRKPAPVWREQPPCVTVMILAGTGPTANAETHLRVLEQWVRDARRQMPRRSATPDAQLFEGVGAR